MAADRERYDMHLTPRGWLNGTSRVGFGPEDAVPTPPDTVLTMHFSEVTSSIYGSPSRSKQVTFESEDKATVDALKQKFGARPNGFEDWG